MGIQNATNQEDRVTDYLTTKLLNVFKSEDIKFAKNCILTINDLFTKTTSKLIPLETHIGEASHRSDCNLQLCSRRTCYECKKTLNGL